MISYTGGLRREFHHIKTNREEGEEWEPCMVILHHNKKGRSFIIPISAFWKYLNPIDIADAQPSDLQDFKRIVETALFKKKVSVAANDKIRAQLDLECCMFASGLWNTNKILPCTGYNLAKMMQMFDIEPRPEAAAQILLFIQDGLEELKNMPELPPEKEVVAGEVTLWEGSRKIADKDLTVKESDLIIEGEGNA